MNTENEFMFQDDELNATSTQVAEPPKKKWKVLIVDDEGDIHQITKLAFRGFEFEGKAVEFYSAYSGKEAEKMVQQHSDIALILLDVVMEDEESGLKFVKYLRNDIKNTLTRVIIRTGQPGQAPEKEVIINYDINDYKEKTELTKDKFYTSLIMALRSFRDLLEIEHSKLELYNMMQAADRFVPHAFLGFLNKNSITDVHLGEHIEQEMSVLFMDIRSFTTTSENLPSLENFNFINSLFKYIEPAIIQHHGFIDKYIGDSVMALFTGSTDNAVLAAMGMLNALRLFNEERKRAHKRPVEIGISINYGMVTLGTIGFDDRMECTAVSDVVNTAAKLEKMNKRLSTCLLITGSVYNKIEYKDRFTARYIGNIQITGKKNYLPVYELFDMDDQAVKALKIKHATLFNQAVSYFDEKQFSQAATCLRQVLDLNPADSSSQFLLQQCELSINQAD